mgnify:FL=1
MKIKNSHKLPGLVLKIFLLGGLNSFALWSVPVLIADGRYLYAAYIAISTLILDYIFLNQKFVAAKYIMPGVILLVAFQIYPAIYTGYIAFTNFSVGHELSKQSAIDSIISNSLEPVGDDSVRPMRIAKSSEGALVLLISESDGSVYAGTQQNIKKLPAGSWTSDAQGNIQSAEGYKLLNDTEISAVLDQLNEFFVPGLEKNVKYRVADFTNVERITPTLRYDSSGDFIENVVTGEKYTPNKNGSFQSQAGEELEPGWTARIGLKNLERVIGDERYRTPLVKVLIWTFIYPFLVVILTFFLGLFLALTINHPKIKVKKLYRILLIVPYAMPGVLSILTWKGMLNESYGIVNKLLPGTIPWLSDPWWAKVAVVLVQLWAGTPYMFLIATGAIQALSTEIVEASEVDGASPRQVFWNIKLPLVVIALTPLLIASYAYNFSNFGSIYLLTGGGPVMYDSGGVAGYTDILISYTYNLAFTAGKGRDYGLASAVSFINFLIVAAISIQAFRRSKQMENIN